jgi:hypothetical protein
MLNSLNGSNYDIALYIFHKYRNDFVCSSLRKNMLMKFKNNIPKKIPPRQWYQYKNDKLIEVDEIGFKKKISEVAKDYTILAKKIM